jgi:hypothetical protein
MQNGDILTIRFDSEEDDNTRNTIFFHLDLPEEGLKTLTTLRLAGTMESTVINAALYEQAHVPESTLASIILSGLSAALVQRNLNSGRPEDLSAHAPELRECAAASFADLWRTRVGLEPGELKLNTVELSSLGKLLVDREREKMKTEPAAAPAAADPAATQSPPVADKWTCACGQVNSGNFCVECGAKREWTCACGQVNTGNFCVECGKKRA